MRRVATWTPDPLRFPRFPLLDGPSPLQPLTGFSGALGDRRDACRAARRPGDGRSLDHGPGRVGGAPRAELAPHILELLADLGALAGLATVPGERIQLDDSQLGAGYGRETRSAGEATRLLATTEGILVDPIYTAKALAGLVAMVGGGALDGRRVVFWHAGGTPGLFEPLPAG